jgi:hypothetical protein
VSGYQDGTLNQAAFRQSVDRVVNLRASLGS